MPKLPSISDPPRVDLPEFFRGIAEWKHYLPPGYPIDEPFHNPWAVVDPIGGTTAYRLWIRERPISEGQFRLLLREMGAKNMDTTWTKVSTTTACKCRECGKVLVRDQVGKSNEVFEAARDHASRHGHTVVILERSEIAVSGIEDTPETQ